MDIQSLRLFVLAAEKLNISAAGRNLGMAPAVASARLAKLEREIGADLLHRSTRRVALSTEGHDFLPYAREIVAQEDAALAALGLTQPQPRGTLRFAAPSTFAQKYIMHLIPEFHARFPDINLDMRLSDAQFDPIEGSFDLALRNQALQDSTLRARKLCDDTRVLCASPAYLERHGTPHHPDELSAHSLVGFRDRQGTRLVSKRGNLSVFDPSGPNCRLVVDDGRSLKLAIMAGAGISMSSLWSIHDELESRSLVRVLPEYQVDEDIALWLVYPKANVLTAKVRVFIDFLIERISDFGNRWTATVDLETQ